MKWIVRQMEQDTFQLEYAESIEIERFEFDTKLEALEFFEAQNRMLKKYGSNTKMYFVYPRLEEST